MSLPVTGVSELVLEVADLEAAERFYAGVLGLLVVERHASGEVLWLMAGAQTRIGLWVPRIGVAGGRGGSHVHFALRIDDDDFDPAVAQLRAAGLDPRIESRRRNTPDASRSAYVTDPDGNCVELWTQDLPAYVERVAGTPVAPGFARDTWWNLPTVRGHVLRARMASLAKLAGHGPGLLLDATAGSGRLLAVLAEHGWTVSGLDARPHLIELARARVPDAADRLAVGGTHELPFPDGTFDVVVAHDVLEYPGRAEALRELVRVVRPGGRVLIGVRRAGTPVTAWRSAVVHPAARAVKRAIPFGRRPPPRQGTPQSARRARRQLGDAGLVVERVEDVGCEVVPDPLDRLAMTFAYRAAARAERSPRLRRVFGAHRLIAAVKPPAPPA